MQLFSADATIFLQKIYFFAHEKIKNPTSKVAYFTALIFLVLPTGLKSAQISYSDYFHGVRLST